ncbi:hypothetical protein H8356DRAFT_1335300 [Neocallimastix lanati (nom. inval.)]|nr:hypothetical protein H8356DRAFT_1335300 [Neocallimastix sp. JGI-2020a]
MKYPEYFKKIFIKTEIPIEHEKLNLEKNENVKIKDYNSDNVSEDNFNDLETLNKRKLRKTKDKDIKFNIKRIIKISIIK